MDEPLRKRRKTEGNADSQISRIDARPLGRSAGRQDFNGACGTISNVTVKNFMCHEHLSVDFESNINLVQGRNGSGKSAILTAVVVALGGSTRTTNRGSNLKELIKYEKSTALVQVTLRNSGRDAFKPETYGESITVERKISEYGGNAYHMKGSNGRIVSSKKEELKRMCDFFNLNVENPLVVLNQDMSRSFLNSTDPKKFYKFFFQATQLQQISDFYQELSDCLETTTSIINDRSACLPQMEREVKELSDRYQFCLKSKEKQEKFKDLRRELAWAEISELEDGKESIEKKLETCLATLAKIENKKASCESIVEEQQRLRKEANDRFNQRLKDISECRVNFNKLNEAQSSAKSNMNDMQREVDKAKRRIETYNKEISALSETVKKDHTAAHQLWEEENERHQSKIQETEAKLRDAEQAKATEEDYIKHLKNTIQGQEDQRRQLQFDCNRRERQIKDLQLELKNLQSQNTNSFTVFGTWVQPLLDRIDVAHRQRKFSAKPVGPVGAYIEMQDNKWTHIAELVIGGRISAFCVNNRNDEKVLRSLFRGLNFGSHTPMIVCCRFRARHPMELISKYEVTSDSYQSLWSTMTIQNDVVANLIIDKCQPETILLIPTAEEAGRILKNANTVPHNCKTAFTLHGDKYFPDPNYKVYSGQGKKNARFLQISVTERAQEVSNELSQAREELEMEKEKVRAFDQEFRKFKEQEVESQQKLKKLRNVAQNLRTKYTQLSNEVGPIRPPDVSQLEEEIRNQESARAAVVEKFEESKLKLSTLSQQYNKAQKAFKEINQTLDTITKEAHVLETEMQEVEENSNKHLHSNVLVEKKLKDLNRTRKELETDMAKADARLQQELKLMESFMPKIRTKRPIKDIERQYKVMAEKLDKEKEQRGDPVEIAENYQKKKEKFEMMKAELDDSKGLVSKIKDALHNRQQMSMRFRKTLSVLVKTTFVGTLTSRKLKGKLLFDFNNETLVILCEKEGSNNNLESSKSQNRSQKRNQQEKLAMMSGGERSFATVALILALWEVMDSPLRMLDEFDVFMDIVARRQSLDMMISATKENRQYIYLTPLEVDKNQYATLNVIRMQDPRENNSMH